MNVDDSKISEVLPHRERFPHTRFSAAARRGFGRLARAISWVWIVLLGVIVLNVTMRYAFGEGRIEFEEIQWHLYALGFLLGLATCADADRHVRVDLFHERLGLRGQAWVELYGLLLLFLPFVVAVGVFSFSFVAYSWEIAEVSDAPGGLPWRWAIKAVVPVAMALLLVAGFARLTRVLAYLFGWPRRVD